MCPIAVRTRTKSLGFPRTSLVGEKQQQQRRDDDDDDDTTSDNVGGVDRRGSHADV